MLPTRVHGRIRAGAAKPWITFADAQMDTYSREPTRRFFLDATMHGLPVDVIHTFVGPSATMRAKVCSAVTYVAGTSSKFWQISRTGQVVFVTFGRIGTKGQTQVKDLATEAAAETHVNKLIAEKTRKGYAEVPPT